MTFRHALSGHTPEFYKQKMARRGDKSKRLNLQIDGPDAGNVVKKPDWRILDVLIGCSAHHGKTHCWPSQAKILWLLWQFHQVRMSRRTLCRHLRALVRLGMLVRRRRHVRDKFNGRGWLMRSTSYTPQIPAAWQIAKKLPSLCKWLKIALESKRYAGGSRVPKLAQYIEKPLKVLIAGSGFHPLPAG